MGESVTEQSTLPPNTFVGRERELAELVAACEAGADSDAHLFLIHGEPGIGKTRLADELASHAKAIGVQVLWGRCWEGGGAPAYWPWIQVVRTFLGALDPKRRRNLALASDIAADVLREVAQIIPDLRPAPSTVQPSVTDRLDPDEARFRLFDAVTNFLKVGARAHPMLIVLDDLHDADEASFAMLRFMARELKGAPMLIVATYREVEMRRSPSLSKLIGELSRDARSIPIKGLSESEVTKLVELRAGRVPAENLVAKLCAATNGNPLFVDGIVRGLIAKGPNGSAGALDCPFEIPSGVRDAIRARLDGLSPQANTILATASVIGNEFEFNLCRNASDVCAEEANRLFDEASSAGIVTAIGQSRYRFCHALIRAAVYEELDTNGRIRIHGKIAAQMEEIYRENIDAHLAELAHHFREAGLAEKAIDYSVRAGQACVSVFAFTDAMTHWGAALGLMEQHGSDTPRRADLLHWLGSIAFEVDRGKSLKYGQSALALYESLGLLDKAAQVHILLGNIFHYRAEPPFDAALASHHLQRAESELTKKPDTISLAHLYAVISANECHLLNVKETERAARRSMEISARLGDKRVWSHAAGRYAWCLVMSGQLREGFALFGEGIQAAVQANVPAYPSAWGAGTLSNWLGDPHGALRYYEYELNRISKEHTPLNHRWLSRLTNEAHFNEGDLRGVHETWGYGDWPTRFWILGEWEAAAASLEKEAGEMQTTGDLPRALNRSLSAGQAYLIYLKDYARAERLFKYGLDDADRGPVVFLEMRARPWLARLYIAMNRIDASGVQLARCRQIMAAGEDWRGLAGDVAQAEAVVAAASGNYDVANRQFGSALAIHQEYHLAWQEADTLQHWGRTLAAAGDRVNVEEKFDAAIENHRSRGVGQRTLEWLTAEKTRALEIAPRACVGGVSHADTANSKVTGTFRREGEFWTIIYRGATFRLKNAKGLHYIAYLLARPGQRIYIHDLIQAVEGSAANGKSIHAESENLEIVCEIGAALPTLDAQARAEYRTRLRDLQAELDEAERMNDLGRSERLRTELEMVTNELTASSGLGGRARTESGSAERARGLVGKNIRSALQKIRQENPALGRYFVAAITTGNYCAYQPEPDQPISWQF